MTRRGRPRHPVLCRECFGHYEPAPGPDRLLPEHLDDGQVRCAGSGMPGLPLDYSTSVTIKVTDVDKERIAQAAKASGTTVSRWLRAVIADALDAAEQ